MVWASLVFDVVGASVGRELGCDEGRYWPW